MSSPPATPHGGPRVVICDYNALLQSVTGLLRMSGYHVFQAYDGQAAQELCAYMPEVDLLVLNTEGTGMDTPELVHLVRQIHPGLPVLHIGKAPIPGMPDDVLNLTDAFGADQLLAAVRTLVSDVKV
jgi:response regulator RpfG family c-di-GMP phosphodiesterase